MLKSSTWAASVAACVFAGAAYGADMQIKVSNLTHGMHFTPIFIAAHGSNEHIYQLGQPASGDLRLLAECGMFADLDTTLSGAGADTVNGANQGLLAPGASQSFQLNSENKYLSMATMLLPTNDAFAGLDGVRIPAIPGNYVFYANAYDAGTEANDEVLAVDSCMAGVPGFPVDPSGAGGSNGSGVPGDDINTNVHIHRGILGDTMADGGLSDANSAVHRFQNPVLKIEVTVK